MPWSARRKRTLAVGLLLIIALAVIAFRRWSTVSVFLIKYEAVAVWIEGLALVAIFFLDWREFERQGREREEQHEETLAQMAAMQRQADGTEIVANAARANAETARENIELLINRERARLVLQPDALEQITSPIPITDPMFKNVAYKITHYGFTPAFIVDARVGAYMLASKEPKRDEFRYLQANEYTESNYTFLNC
jgi:hypothetical protein